MSNILAYEKDFSIIKKGSNYDEDILGKERERIAANMRDRGYYLFNKNYITYDPDSSLNSNQVDVYLYLNRINENVEQSGNELPVENHQRYHLNKIYIQLDYDPKNPFSSKLNDAVPYKDYFFVYDSTSEYIKKDAILNCLFIKTGDRFYQHDIDYTNVRLNELGVFKFINFQFKPVARDTTKTEYLLNVYIQLSPNARQEYKTETEATNTGSNLGLAASFGYRNKNIFRGAEVLEFKISAAFEALRNLNDINVSRKLLFFNSVEVGPEINLTFKKFLIPEFIRKGFSRRFNPKTTISTGFNYQTRPEYTRRILKFAFGFQWIGSATQRFYWYPFEINSVQVDLSTEFQDKIIANYDNNLINSYSDHLITDGRFTWIYNNQKAAYKNFQNVRVNFETSGFSLRLLNNSAFAKLDTVNESYSLFGIRYSQYAKIDIDATYHQYINQNNVMVYRFAGGFGLTTGNSKKYLLPFEKTFFSGGANGIRAWQARSLGPGSYKDEIKIDQAGDIKLEVNIEYRSSILKILEGAVFADAGNVWIRGDRADAWEGSKFVIGEFVNQVALGAGIGVRFNFSFFIIRLDAAVKLRDPARELPYRWVYAHQKLNLADVLFNLAIGYPF